METARDLAIVILAVESIIVLIVQVVLIVQLIRLVKLLREEVMPIVKSAQETVGTVRGTTAFVSDHLVRPVVRASSYVAGARQALGVLFGRRGRP